MIQYQESCIHTRLNLQYRTQSCILRSQRYCPLIYCQLSRRCKNTWLPKKNKTMDFFLNNADELMKLAFGGGFLLLVIFVVRSLIIVTRVVQKIDGVVDVVTEYIYKPVQIMMQVYKAFDHVKGFFGKK